MESSRVRSSQALQREDQSSIKEADQIGEWALSNANLDFAEDEMTQLATYKAFQEITEACLDIVAMICKDSGGIPRDDYPAGCRWDLTIWLLGNRRGAPGE